MLILNLFLLIALSQSVVAIQFLMTGPKNSDNYGPYLLGLKYFGSCQNSEKDLANMTVELECEKNVYKGVVNITLSQAVRIVAMKSVIYSVKNNRKNQLWDFVIEKPCQNRLISEQLKSHVDIRTCVLRKGTHSLAINFSESVYLFFGTSFFYGEYIAKFTMFSAKKQTIGCYLADELIIKKSLTPLDICHLPHTGLENVNKIL